jgi:hypothetical protein
MPALRAAFDAVRGAVYGEHRVPQLPHCQYLRGFAAAGGNALNDFAPDTPTIVAIGIKIM